MSFKELIFFFKNTNNLSLVRNNVEDEPILVFLKTTFLYLLFVLVFSVAITIVAEAANIQFYNKAQSPQYPNQTYRIAFIIVILPILEEFMFRYCLKEFEIKKILFSFSLLSGYVAIWILYFLAPDNPIFSSQVYQYLVIASLSLIFFFILNNKIISRRLTNLDSFWNKNLIKIAVVSSVLFSAFHYKSVYEPSSLGIILNVIYITPKILFGLIAFFNRYCFGVIYAILFHLIVNSISIVI